MVPYKIAVPSYANFAFMVILVSVFTLLWFKKDTGYNWQSLLIPYGRMSLTKLYFSVNHGSNYLLRIRTVNVQVCRSNGKPADCIAYLHYSVDIQPLVACPS